MASHFKTFKEKIFTSKANTFCFFLFLVGMIAGVVMLVTMPLYGGGFIVPALLIIPFFANIIGSYRRGGR